jgi:HK97 family phage portal protein
MVQRGYLDNGIIWACIQARYTLYAQARLELENTKDEERRPLPPRLAALVEKPWPNGSQSELLARTEQDVSLAGNWYLYQAEPRRLQRLRPDWVDIVLDPAGQELAGYLYHPGGRHMRNPVPLLPEEVAHGSPYPDPLAAFRGASWMTSITREVLGDTAMNNHKLKFFEHGATPNLLVTVQGSLSDTARERFSQALREKFGGVTNAYKTLVLEEGADATVVGSDMRQVTFDVVQAAGEGRIAVASGVPAVVLGIKEGADQATYNNYGSALQHFANFPMQHLWEHTASTLGNLFPVPQGWRFAYKTDHIPALQSDQKQDAEILETQATTIREFVDAGFTHESAIEAVDTGDLSVLVKDETVTPNALDVAAETDTDEDEEPADDDDNTLAFLSA